MTIETDWTITPTVIISAIALISGLGGFRKLYTTYTTALKKKEKLEQVRMAHMEEMEKRIIGLVAKFEALTYAFLFSKPTDDEATKKRIYEKELADKMDELQLMELARELERKKLRELDLIK